MTLHPLGMCSVPAASLPPGIHHLGPVCKSRHKPSVKLVDQQVPSYKALGLFCLVVMVSYINSEVAWGAGDVSSWGQSLGDVLHAEGCGQDPQGQADHQVALRALECPAITGVDIRLEERGRQRRVLLLCLS